MPQDLPGFLQDFMKHRAYTHKSSNPTPQQVKKDSLTSVKKNDDLEMGVAGIIDKKPPRAVLDEFLQKRCDELSKIKMSK
jgi:hypothetical protein